MYQKEAYVILFLNYKSTGMTARICILSLILLLNMQLLTCQEKSPEELILLQGLVMDAESLEPLPNAHYVINRMFGNVTDEKGEFSVYLGKKDTLKISYVGYRDIVFTAADTLKGNTFTAGFFLHSDTLALGEVIIVPRIPNLGTGILLETPVVSQEEMNARNNMAASVYQGLNSRQQLGDPSANYELMRRKHMQEAIEKGAIPSNRMVGINFLAIPAAILYYAKGPPERSNPPRPMISQKEIERMKDLYRKNLGKDQGVQAAGK